MDRIGGIIGASCGAMAGIELDTLLASYALETEMVLEG